MAAFGSDELKVLTELPLTSKDGKALVPAITSFFENFQEKVNLMLTEIRDEFMTLLHQKDGHIGQLQSELGTMKSEVGELRDELTKLKGQIDDADAYERRDTIIISGEKVPLATPGEIGSEVVLKLVKDELKINLSPDSISTAHRLGRKPPNQTADRRNLIVKLVRRDVKHDIISASRQQPRRSNLYISESLTPARSSLFFALRQMKKSKLIKGCTTYDGRVYAFTAPLQESHRDVRHLISNYEDLTKFCAKYVKQPLQNFLETWTH